MRPPGPVKWVALALLGLAIAGGVAFAASRLASQQIGIASESISAGRELAPAVRSAGRERTGPTDTATPRETTEAEPERAAPTKPPDETTDRQEAEPGEERGEGADD